eukprot:693745-Amphidinium_carterae.1
MAKVVKEATESRSQQKAHRLQDELGGLREGGEHEHTAKNQAEQAVRSMQDAGDRRFQKLD